MTDNNVIRVMIVDDHDMVRSSLEILLETCDDLQLVGEANSGENALQVARHLHPDVALIDLMMPGIDGIEVIKGMRVLSPETRMVVLTSFKDGNLVQEALEAGALSYVLKNVSIDELAEVIRAAYAGQSSLSPEASQALQTFEANQADLPSTEPTLPAALKEEIRRQMPKNSV